MTQWTLYVGVDALAAGTAETLCLSRGESNRTVEFESDAEPDRTGLAAFDSEVSSPLDGRKVDLRTPSDPSRHLHTRLRYDPRRHPRGLALSAITRNNGLASRENRAPLRREMGVRDQRNPHLTIASDRAAESRARRAHTPCERRSPGDEGPSADAHSDARHTPTSVAMRTTDCEGTGGEGGIRSRIHLPC